MASPAPHRAEGAGIPPFPDEALIEEMERIQEPAVLYLPGGRIAAVNRAAARLADIRTTGVTVGELVERYGIRRPGGSPLLPADLPCVRALRGEVVEQGEHVDMTLPDGTVYRTLVTSSPVIVDGRVMGALSIWHDFDAYIRTLVSPPGRLRAADDVRYPSTRSVLEFDRRSR